MEEKYKKFKEFDWVNNEEWQSYYRNLYPAPPPKKILRYKKKFFRNKIDSDFDIDYVPPEEKEEEENKQQQQQNSNTSSSQSTNSDKNNNNSFNNSNNNNNQSNNNYSYEKKENNDKNSNINNHYEIKKIAEYIELLLMSLFIFSLVIRFKPIQVGIVAFLFRSIRIVGKPQLSMDYLQRLILKDSFQTLLFIFESLIDKFYYYIMIPPLISTIIAISEAITRNKINLGIKVLNNFFIYVINNKEKLYQEKSNIQVGIGFFSIIGWFFGMHSIIIIFAYWQLVRLLYKFNPRVAKSLNNLDILINEFKNKEQCPGIIKLALDKIQNIFYFFGNLGNSQNQGTQGGNGILQNCNIF